MFKKKNKFNEDPVSFNKSGGIEAPPEKIINIKIQPPAIFAISLLLGLILNYFFIKLESNLAFVFPLGCIVSVFGIFINMWSMNKYRLYKTSPHPKHQAFKLITDGPYKFSRNPLYLGTFLMIFGFGLASDLMFICISSIISLVLINFFVVLPEENYLEDLFGDTFRSYKIKVRRWL